MKNSRSGFTLIELVVVLAVVALLATMAVPSIQGKLVREQIVEAMKIADLAKAPVMASWALTRTLPADNAGAGLPAAEKIVGNLVSSVTVEAGAIHVTFGNRANAGINGKQLTLRPAVVEDAPMVPLAWVCGHAEAVEKMTAKGVDRTTVPNNFLPLNCLAKPK